MSKCCAKTISNFKGMQDIKNFWNHCLKTVHSKILTELNKI